MKKHYIFMKQAIKEAEKAYKKDEVPVGAILVKQDKIIARAHNLIRKLKDPTAHAEILAIKKAGKKIGNERLIGTTLYTTIEPCSMCAGAIILARIEKLVFGAQDLKTGACGSVFKIINNKKNNHKVKIVKNVMKEECAEIIQKFFKEKRKKLRRGG